MLIKEILLTKEQFDTALMYAKQTKENPPFYAGHYGHDCIEFTQEIYRAAGQQGDFVDQYTYKELKNLGSWAATSAQRRFGAGDEYFTVYGYSKELIAKKYNVDIERIIDMEKFTCTTSMECANRPFNIEPILLFKPNYKK